MNNLTHPIINELYDGSKDYYHRHRHEPDPIELDTLSNIAPEIREMMELDERLNEAINIIDLHCNYDCYYYDCGEWCPERCWDSIHNDYFAVCDEMDKIVSL